MHGIVYRLQFYIATLGDFTFWIIQHDHPEVRAYPVANPKSEVVYFRLGSSQDNRELHTYHRTYLEDKYEVRYYPRIILKSI